MTPGKLAEVMTDWITWGFTQKLKQELLSLQEEKKNERKTETSTTDTGQFNSNTSPSLPAKSDIGNQRKMRRHPR